MTYEQAVAYIDEIPKFTKKNTLDNTRAIMERLGNPDRSMKILHVAGTNGKGSVCAYLSSVLTRTGKKTGLFTSPHLVKINERFIINQEEISDETFLKAFHRVMEVVEASKEEGVLHPTYFEMLFLIGMVIFAQEQVEYLILETGLGGRKDATNVVEQPLISIITSIGIDHVEYLGDTYEAIAGEKAGIIKQGVPVVYDANRADVAAVMENRAKETGSRTFPVDSGMYKIEAASYKKIDFYTLTEYYETIKLEISSVAEYQVMNALLAVTALKAIAAELDLTDEMIQEGIHHMKWQGRMETVLPGVIVDGAHNEPGVAQFVKTVQKFQKECPITYVFAAVNDKDYEKMIQTICEETSFRKVIVTEVNSYRRTPAGELAEIFKRHTDSDVIVCENSEEAFELGIREKGDGLLFCVGSLYLVGDLKSFIGRNNHD